MLNLCHLISICVYTNVHKDDDYHKIRNYHKKEALFTRFFFQNIFCFQFFVLDLLFLFSYLVCKLGVASVLPYTCLKVSLLK